MAMTPKPSTLAILEECSSKSIFMAYLSKTIMSTLNSDQRKSHLNNLIRIAKADEVLAPEEVMLIKSVAAQIGITEEEFAQIVSEPARIRLAIPYDTKEKITQFYECCMLTIIDQNIADKEWDICRSLGTYYGLNSMKVDKAMEYVKAQSGKILDFETFKSHLS